MQLVLTLGDLCNRSCDYCYADRRRPQAMTFDVARRAIDLAREQGDGTLQIGFFGGEPLLQFPLLREVADHARRTCDEAPSFALTTSGDPVTEEVAAYLGGLDVSVALSAHDADDRGTRRAARRLRAVGIEPGVVFVATPEGCGELPARVEALLQFGVRRVSISPDFYAEWAPSGRARLEATYRELARLYAAERRAGRPFVLNQFDPRLRALATGVSQRATQCGVGPDKLAVAPDGELFPCDRLSVDSACADTRLGHVDDGLEALPRPEALVAAAPCEGCEDDTTCLCGCACVNAHFGGDATVVPEVVRWHERTVGAIVREQLHPLRPAPARKRRGHRFVRVSAGVIAAGALVAGCGEAPNTATVTPTPHGPDEICKRSALIDVGAFALRGEEEPALARVDGRFWDAAVTYCLHFEDDDLYTLVDENREAIEDAFRRRLATADLEQVSLPEEEAAFGKLLMADVHALLGAKARLRGVRLSISQTRSTGEMIRQLKMMGYVGD